MLQREVLATPQPVAAGSAKDRRPPLRTTTDHDRTQKHIREILHHIRRKSDALHLRACNKHNMCPFRASSRQRGAAPFQACGRPPSLNTPSLARTLSHDTQYGSHVPRIYTWLHPSSPVSCLSCLRAGPSHGEMSARGTKLTCLVEL